MGIANQVRPNQKMDQIGLVGQNISDMETAFPSRERERGPVSHNLGVVCGFGYSCGRQSLLPRFRREKEREFNSQATAMALNYSSPNAEERSDMGLHLCSAQPYSRSLFLGCDPT